MDGDKDKEKGYDKIRDQILELCKLAQGNITTIIWCKNQIKKRLKVLDRLVERLTSVKESTDEEKKIHIALVEQNLAKLCKYKFKDVLLWSNKITKANEINKIYSSTYFKRQLYLRLIRVIKGMQKKSILDMLKLKGSAEFYDANISLRDLFYIYRTTSNYFIQDK